MTKVKYYLTVLAAVISVASCQSGPATNQVASVNANAAASAKWDAYVEQFLNDYFAANPTFGRYQGKHEYDGKVAGLERGRG